MYIERDIRYMEPIVSSCIPLPQFIQHYKKAKNCTRSRDILSRISIYRFNRTGDANLKTRRGRKKEYYSGKKKKHTVKTQYMVNKEGIILHKSNQHKKGQKHDYSVYKDEHLTNNTITSRKLF